MLYDTTNTFLRNSMNPKRTKRLMLYVGGWVNSFSFFKDAGNLVNKEL